MPLSMTESDVVLSNYSTVDASVVVFDICRPCDFMCGGSVLISNEPV